MLDVWFAGSERAQLRELFVGGLVVEIGVKHPFVGFRLVWLVRDDDGRRGAVREQVPSAGDRFALRAGAGEGDPIAYCTCSFASLSSKAFRPRSA